MTAAPAFRIGSALLQARADGLLSAIQPVQLPFMAPRLQGDVWPDGRLEISLWGAGRLANILFAPLLGPYVLGPNRMTMPHGGIHVAQSASVMVICGSHSRRVAPARRAAWWHRPTDAEAQVRMQRRGQDRVWALGWGCFAIRQVGADMLVSVGADEAECLAALALTPAEIIAEAAEYVALCDRMPEGDPVLRSMVIQGTHAALSSIRQDDKGEFGGLAAGQAYSAPARTYYRDGYWTLQPLLTLRPDAVRDQIRVLAAGIQPDGEAPSGVIMSGSAQAAAWDRFRRSDAPYREEHLRPGDWWSDHFDSPLFFVLTLGDYVRATGDSEELVAHAAKVRAVFDRYVALAGADGLPMKPAHDRDWADNVYRQGAVAYDLGLWVGALDVMAAWPEMLGLDPARVCALGRAARQAMDGVLWREAAGNHAEYANSGGYAESRLALDSLTLLRHDATSPAHAVLVLENARARLETRHNPAQPYGDWGVMCGWPAYSRRSDTRAKSAFAYRYHNGSDWPYLDAIYAAERLRRGLGGARYALTRWWQACLDNGWAGSVEYYSPPFGRGSLLQGWSGLPAHVAISYRDQVLAEEDDKPEDTQQR